MNESDPYRCAPSDPHIASPFGGRDNETSDGKGGNMMSLLSFSGVATLRGAQVGTSSSFPIKLSSLATANWAQRLSATNTCLAPSKMRLVCWIPVE